MLQRLFSLTAWGGILALLASGVLPWVKIPVGSETGEIISSSPTAVRPFQYVCLSVSCILICIRRFKGGWGDGTRTVAVVCFMLLLLFPYFSIDWDPNFTAQASWLQMQHENLTWLGGDVCTGAEFSDSALKSRVYVVDPPRRLTVFRVPTTSPWDMEMSQLGDLLDWLGYTESFCQFIGKGWFAAMFGAASVVLASCVIDREKQRDHIIRSIRLMAAIGVLGAAVAWSLPFRTGFNMSQAEGFVRDGKYEMALDRLEAAALKMPVLRHDTSFVAQKGRLDHLLGLATAEGRLYGSTRLEAAGRFSEAANEYRALIQETPIGSPVRRESCRALLRDAIHSLNSGRVNAAEEQLREVLNAEPTNLMANYALQLACLRSGRHEELEALFERLYRVYAYFQSPTKVALLSSLHSINTAATLDGNQPGAALRAYRKSIQP